MAKRGGDMNISTKILFGVAAACAAAPEIARAAPLSVVEVTAPDINCVFNTTCKLTVTDSVGDVSFPGMSGKGILQSRTFSGASGAPGDGKTGYEYRVDLTQATAIGDVACVTDLTVDFGAVTKLQYNNAGPVDDVYVVTKGGLGTIKLASADQTGNVITFVFSQPVCAADPSTKGETSYFFGLASAWTPKAITATVGIPGLGQIKVDARAPTH